jgi:DNA-binding response OmpR family regulator
MTIPTFRPIRRVAPRPPAFSAESRRAAEVFAELLSALPAIPTVLVDLAGRAVAVNGLDCPLTRREFDLLAHLVRAEARSASRWELLATVWSGHPVTVSTRTIDVHVARLREKLGLESIILSERGLGYRLNPAYRFDIVQGAPA